LSTRERPHRPWLRRRRRGAGQWIALLGSPADWRHGLIALVLFPLFDITKPFPVRRLERLPGGWGIVFDDVAAGLYALGSVVAAHLDLKTMPRSYPTRFRSNSLPRVDEVVPAAALPLGEVELKAPFWARTARRPAVYVDGEAAHRF
jgi:hypothetical protein